MRTRTMLAASLALLLAVPAGTAAPLIDQIDNGGFETFEDDDPVEWRVIAGEANPTSDAYEGDTALLLNAVGDSTVSAVGQNISLETNDTIAVPNGTYDLDFAALLDTGDTNPVKSPPDARARVLWKDLSGQVTDVDIVDIDRSSTYQTYNASVQAPLDAVEAEVQFHLERPLLTDPTDASLKVDDVAFGPALPV